MNRIFYSCLKKMLERSGYEVDMATNGMEGIELFRVITERTL